MTFSDAYVSELDEYNDKVGDPHVDEHIMFRGVSLTPAQGNASDAIIDAATGLESEIMLWLHPSRETSLALTKLEEAVMWANKSIAKNGVTGE